MSPTDSPAGFSENTDLPKKLQYFFFRNHAYILGYPRHAFRNGVDLHVHEFPTMTYVLTAKQILELIVGFFLIKNFENKFS